MSPTTTRRSGPERREQIAGAALEIIGREGLAGISTAALADAVGLTTGALFRHFESRDAILAETVRLAVVQVEGTFPDAALPPLERLRALAQARIALLTKSPGVGWLLRSAQARASLPAPAVRRLNALVKRSRGFLLEALEEAAAAGDVRSDVPPPVLLLIFTSTVHALVGAAGKGARGAPGPAQAVDGLLTLLTPSTPSPKRS
jgi:TetR/AcrR family transcriptional regulator